MLIQYIGHREEYKDALYGSGYWLKNQVKEVADVVATRMLKHPDLYGAHSEAVEECAGVDVVEFKEAATDSEEDHDQAARDAISAMLSKEAIADYAKVNFGQVIPKTLSLDNMRQRAIMMIDQYGSR